MAHRWRLLGSACVGLLVGVIPALFVGLSGSPAGAAPAGYSITGIDVSAYQGSIDWTSVAAGGAQFAYIRASEQADLPDAYFDTNYPAAKANGLYVGAYHRARPTLSSGKAQADFLVDRSRFADDGRTLPPMLDIEWPRSTWTGVDACYSMTPAQITAWIRDFVDEVKARTGRLAMIYTNPNWWNPCTGNNTTFGANPLFNSGYLASPPAPPAGWSTWNLWQYSDSGSLPGDQDVFNGDFAALAQLAGGKPIVLRSQVNGKFVTADKGGADPLIANRSVIGPWEKFDVIDLGDGYVALRSHANGKLVTAENAGSKPLIANRSVIGTWEKFKMVTGADGSLSLLANANGQYVSAAMGGADPLIANRTAIGLWEQFDKVLPQAPIGLKARVNGKYVTAEKGGASPLIANRSTLGLWETFEPVDAGGGFIALFARVNSRYVTAENAGASALIANRTEIGPWEKFKLIVNADGSVSLLANANGKYVTAEKGGAEPLIANRTEVGSWEEFDRQLA